MKWILITAVLLSGCCPVPGAEEIKDPVVLDCVRAASSSRLGSRDQKEIVVACLAYREKQRVDENLDSAKRLVNALTERNEFEAKLDKIKADYDLLSNHCDSVRDDCIEYCGETPQRTEEQCEWNCGN